MADLVKVSDLTAATTGCWCSRSKRTWYRAQPQNLVTVGNNYSDM